MASHLVSCKYLHEAKELLSVTIPFAENILDYDDVFNLKRMYAITLWHYHFYGYDDYRLTLRKALEIIEDLVDDSVRVRGEDHKETRLVLGLLGHARNVQLDWCIDDLTPATFHACGPGLLLESSIDSEEDADADASTAS